MKFRAQIEDEDGEVKLECSTYMSEIKFDGSCESVEMELFSMLRAFKRIQEKEDSEKLQEIELDSVV